MARSCHTENVLRWESSDATPPFIMGWIHPAKLDLNRCIGGGRHGNAEGLAYLFVQELLATSQGGFRRGSWIYLPQMSLTRLVRVVNEGTWLRWTAFRDAYTWQQLVGRAPDLE